MPRQQMSRCCHATAKLKNLRLESRRMPSTAETTVFACVRDTLLGILARPATPADTAVVVGGPQYRASSHQQFLLLSRALAASGIAVLRFDNHGMGHSSVAQPEWL